MQKNKLKKILFYSILVFALYLVFRVVDFGTFLILRSQNFEKVKKYPSNSQHITYSSDFVYLSQINSLGIRNEELSEKTKKRILFLGDSFVYGVGVDRKETMVSLLSKKMNNKKNDFELINAGIIGNSPKQSRLMYEYLNPIVSPDIVVFCLYTNDVFDSGENRLSRKTRDFFIKHNKLLQILNFIFPKSVEFGINSFIMIKSSDIQADAKTIKIIDSETKNSTAILQNFKKPTFSQSEQNQITEDFLNSSKMLSESLNIPKEKYELWKQNLGEDMIRESALGNYNSWQILYGLTEPLYFKESLEITGDAQISYHLMLDEINLLQEQTKQNHQKFLIIYVSSELQYSQTKQELNQRIGYEVDPNWLVQESELEKRLIQYSRSNHIPFLSLTDSLRAASNSGKKLVWDFDLHWNTQGNKIASDAIYPFLIEEIIGY